jgi:hypothetical protein
LEVRKINLPNQTLICELETFLFEEAEETTGGCRLMFLKPVEGFD